MKTSEGIRTYKIESTPKIQREHRFAKFLEFSKSQLIDCQENKIYFSEWTQNLGVKMIPPLRFNSMNLPSLSM